MKSSTSRSFEFGMGRRIRAWQIPLSGKPGLIAIVVDKLRPDSTPLITKMHRLGKWPVHFDTLDAILRLRVIVVDSSQVQRCLDCEGLTHTKSF
jgi:hypothetical protein